jgi:Uncharacterized protein conserved in bacteria (DUF2188)
MRAFTTGLSGKATLERRSGLTPVARQGRDGLEVAPRGHHDRIEEEIMAKIHYRIVQHDGGWAYKLDDVFSEPFATRKAAIAATKRVIREQHTPGDTTHIEYQDEAGKWHEELSEGDDRPDADILG